METSIQKERRILNIAQRISRAQASIVVNQGVRKVFAGAGCTDFEKINRNAMIRSARLSMLIYAMQLECSKAAA